MEAQKIYRGRLIDMRAVGGGRFEKKSRRFTEAVFAALNIPVSGEGEGFLGR